MNLGYARMHTLAFSSRFLRRTLGLPMTTGVSERLAARVRRGNMIALAILTGITLGYLALVNDNATAGYELRTVEQRAAELREEVRRLEIATIAAQSNERLAARVANHGFVPVAQVRYLDADHAVARR